MTLTSKTPISRTASLLMLLLVVLALGAAACGAGDDSASSVSDASFDSSAAEEATSGGFAASQEPPRAPGDDGADDFAVDAEVAAEGERGVTTGSASTQPTAQLPDIGRDIIYTAELELGTTDVTTATREAIRTVESHGGFLFSQETRGGAGGSSVLVFKILPDEFQAALTDLGSIGSVRSQSISADDVTALVVDLESRINTAEASVRRLRDLLDEADEFEIIAALENQLLQRETTLEQLRGQLRSVQSQVDLATITVRVTELLNRPGMSLQASAYSGHDGGFSCFEPAFLSSTEPDEPTTICYRITNTGDTPLVDLALDDPAFGVRIGDLVIVDGTPTQLDPGESVLLAYEFELSETVRVRTAVTATALDTDGNPLPDEVKATAATFRLDVVEPDDGIPSFGDAWSGSLSALATIAIVIALVAVAIAPFLVVGLVLFGVGSLLWRRFKPAPKAPEPTAEPTPEPTLAAPPPPPAPRPDFDASKVVEESSAGATPQATPNP